MDVKPPGNHRPLLTRSRQRSTALCFSSRHERPFLVAHIGDRARSSSEIAEANGLSRDLIQMGARRKCGRRFVTEISLRPLPVIEDLDVFAERCRACSRAAKH
ncbi:hypothetical protein Bxe_C1148 [Paraburkholderia xenovorans LB400]|uniref:Uncharacterized protein n=1 Tax=Paraburkholderia xenovorans (strain LB400) TaxID=266265 RepID=Q13FX6_PARXL|nr:hypothetical protein Bxe_C1148 [Paraburkholderia xenovorans LB400]